MPASTRRTVSIDTFEQFRAQFGREPGHCFVPVSAPDGATLSLLLATPGQPAAELQGVVMRSDFDEQGNEGVLLALRPESVALVNQLGKALERATLAPTSVRTPAPAALLATHVRPTAPENQATGNLADAPAPLQAPGDLTEALLEPGTTVDGRFRITSHLATGGMGEVYRANHVHLKRPVALKLMRRVFATDPEMWGRFQREAELVSQLESPHVVRTFDFGRTENGQPYLAMEFVEGETLDRELERGPMAPARAISILQQVCAGLSEAHALGVIHRDLKPANIIIGRRRDGEEVVKILDFGIARLADSPTNQKQQRLTQMGFVVGTPAYIAPEQALAAEVDQRTDIYAMGCVAYELLTGNPPFVSPDLPRTISMHLTQPPTPLEERRPELAGWPALCHAVLQALSKERSQRQPTVKELSAALARDGAGSAPPPITQPVVQLAPGLRLSPQPTQALRAAPAAQPPGAPQQHRAPTPGPSLRMPAITAPGRAPQKATGVLPALQLPTQPAVPTPLPAAPTADFDQLELGPPPGPAGRRGEPLAATIAALASDRAQAQLQAARDAVDETVRRGVFAYVELLGVPQDSPAWRACLGRMFEVLASFGGFADSRDEDGLLLGFTSANWLPVGRAASALLAMGDAVADEAARLEAPVKVRGALVSSELKHGARSVGVEALERAHGLSSRFQAGQLVAQKVLAQDLGHLVDTKATYSVDVLQLTERRVRAPVAVELQGRAELFESLERRLAKLATGQGMPVLLVGLERAGRTAVAHEFAARARKKSLGGWVVSAFPSWRRVPNSAVAALVCAMCEVPFELRSTRLRAALEALKLPAPMVEAALVAGGVTQPAWPFTTGQLVHALRTVARARAGEKPLYFVFDGLEHCDEPALDVLAELLLRPAPNELTVALTLKSVPLERFEGVAKAEVGELDEAYLARLVQLSLGAPPGPRLLQVLLERGKSLPGLVHDWLSLLDARGALLVKSQVAELIDDVPEVDAADLTRARLELLPADAARLLEAAWCLGETFETPMIARAWPRASQAAVQKVSAARLVVASHARRWTFTSPRVHAAVGQLASRERPSLHQRLASALVELGRADPTSVDPLEVGRQFVGAGDGARASALLQHAAEAALARRAPRDAARALELLAEALGKVTPVVPARRIEALSRAVSCLLASFDPASARLLFDAALELAQQASIEPPELMLAMTKVFRAETRRTRAAEALDKAELLCGGTRLEALVWVERGEALEQDGDLDGAAKALQSALSSAAEAEAVQAARSHGEVDLVARLEGRLGGLFLQRKDIAHARHLFDSSAHHWRLAQVRAGEARALANLATACAVDRDLGAAARWYGTAAEAALRAGDFLFAAKSYVQQARALKKLDPGSADARAAATEARKLAMAVGWEQGRLEAVQLLT